MITYIKTVGYNRFSLVGNGFFELTIKELVLVIIGMNGAGKSALLSQMTPMPPSPADYDKAGSKETHHFFRNKNYILKAIFSPQPRYYFECDGEVLNDWGNSSLQKSLVEQHFGISAKIQSLMQGNTMFSKMSPMERKDWFIAISNVDYDYAIDVFTKAKEKQRDYQGSLKIQRKKLAAEVTKKVSDVDLAARVKEAAELESMLESLYREKPKPESDIDSALYALKEATKKTEKLALSYVSAVDKLPVNRWGKAAYKHFITTLDQRIYAVTTLIASKSKEMEKNASLIRLLERTKQANADQLNASIAEAEQTIDRLKKTLVVDTEINGASEALSMFDDCYGDICSLLAEIPDNTEGIYSKSGRAQAESELNALRQQIDKSERLHNKIIARLEHLGDHKEKTDVECPKCGHEHSAVYTEKEHNELMARDAQAKLYIDTLRQKEKDLMAYCETVVSYLTKIAHWNTIKDACRKLQPYWEWLDQNKLFTASASPKSHLLMQARSCLVTLTTIEQQRKRQADDAKLLTQVQRADELGGQDELSRLKAEQQLSETTLNNLNRKISRYHEQKRCYELHLRLLSEVESIEKEMALTYRGAVYKRESYFHELRCEAYSDTIRSVQDLLAEKRQFIHQARFQEQNVRMLEEQIEQMSKEEKIHAAIAETMSPKTGLIAKGLYGFIEKFFEDINSLIEHVWTYEMRLLVGKEGRSDDMELDYKFPVEIIQKERVVLKDVSHGDEASKGQTEMIDLAFLITALVYLGLTEFPLMLDEIGNRFDAEHKKNLTTLLKNLVDQKAFPQVFMVSHDFYQYTALSAQVVVLESANIVAIEKKK